MHLVSTGVSLGTLDSNKPGPRKISRAKRELKQAGTLAVPARCYAGSLPDEHGWRTPKRNRSQVEPTNSPKDVIRDCTRIHTARQQPAWGVAGRWIRRPMRQASACLFPPEANDPSLMRRGGVTSIGPTVQQSGQRCSATRGLVGDRPRGPPDFLIRPDGNRGPLARWYDPGTTFRPSA